MYRTYKNIKKEAENKFILDDGGLVALTNYSGENGVFQHTLYEYLKKLSDDFPDVVLFSVQNVKMNMAQYLRKEKTKLYIYLFGHKKDEKLIHFKFVFNCILSDSEYDSPFTKLLKEGADNTDKKVLLEMLHHLIFPDDLGLVALDLKYKSAYSLDTVLNTSFGINEKVKLLTVDDAVQLIRKYPNQLNNELKYMCVIKEIGKTMALFNEINKGSDTSAVGLKTNLERIINGYANYLNANSKEAERFNNFNRYNAEVILNELGMKKTVINSVPVFKINHRVKGKPIAFYVLPNFLIVQVGNTPVQIMNLSSTSLNNYIKTMVTFLNISLDERENLEKFVTFFNSIYDGRKKPIMLKKKN